MGPNFEFEILEQFRKLIYLNCIFSNMVRLQREDLHRQVQASRKDSFIKTN